MLIRASFISIDTNSLVNLWDQILKALIHENFKCFKIKHRHKLSLSAARQPS